MAQAMDRIPWPAGQTIKKASVARSRGKNVRLIIFYPQGGYGMARNRERAQRLCPPQDEPFAFRESLLRSVGFPIILITSFHSVPRREVSSFNGAVGIFGPFDGRPQAQNTTILFQRSRRRFSPRNFDRRHCNMDLNKVGQILKKCELFTDLSDQELNRIADFGILETYHAGATIYEQGSVGMKIYVLSEGQVSLERTLDLGRRSMGNATVYVLREIPNRRLFGSWSTLVGEEHVQMCTAKCDKPTEVVSLPCSHLRTLLIEAPNIRLKILEKLILILRERLESSYSALETL